ncbi:DUF5337 domain-containing protein [Aliiroseovarius lamellibrachiae]|uniref:DUF5337 domain-containing protein n=1 Tax=Aliiroseovarius lamellibrachiae TaxID=1924933 RepID=UPI001BE0E8F0|nr:DUF5337 domain-containing protein [Aliiroseovarius lamellibrachiae]MBT2130911.1 DUF5337 family protein [Aliiroseovarius lamellibrachiae]
MATDPHHKTGREGRMAGLVIAMTGALWVGASWVGKSYGWSMRTMALVDLMALAGFVFGLVVTYRIWRKSRQHDEG